MSHLFFLRPQIIGSVSTRRNFAGHALDHLNSSALERRYFIWIIRKQPHLLNTQRRQRLRRQSELTMVRPEPKLLVRLDSVEPGVLQFISLQLRHQSNAAPFLLFVKQNACTLASDHRQCHFQLLPAIASQRSKHVAGQALRMYPH